MRKQSEHAIQAQLIKELNYKMRPEVVRFAVPNGGHRRLSTALQLKAEGVLPGMPDLGFAVEHGQVFWLEMKAEKGRLSDHQMGIKHKLEKLDHRWEKAHSVEQAMTILQAWGILK